MAVFRNSGLLLAALFLSPTRLTATPDHLFLIPGQSETVHLPGAAELRVSRRGIVDLVQLQDDAWRITGLERGLVAIAVKQKDRTEGTRLLVEVAAREDASEKGRKLAPMPFPKQFCALKSLACDEKSRSIRGQMDDFERFFALQRLCKQRETCTSEVRLSALGWQAFVERYSHDASQNIEIKTMPTGKVILIAYCEPSTEPNGESSRQWVDFLTGGAVGSGEVGFRCRQSWETMRYRVKARVFLIEDDAASELGLKQSQNYGASLNEHRPTGDFLLQLRALEESRQAKTIAEPLVRVEGNHEATIASGGEFQTLYESRSEDGRTLAAWKRYGTELKVKVSPVSDKNVSVDFRLMLDNREPGPATASLQTNLLQTSLRTPLNQPLIVGGADVMTEAGKMAATAFLSDIPIIGPLFRLRTQDRQNLKVFMWILVGDDQEGDDFENGLAPWPAPTTAASAPKMSNQE